MPTPTSDRNLRTTRPTPASHRRILELPQSVLDDEGNVYRARVFASSADAGAWGGWLQFRLEVPGRPTVSTGQETAQGSPSAVTQWALHLAPDYARGALQRALRRSGRPSKPLPRLVGPRVIVSDEAGMSFESRVFVQAHGHIWIAWMEFEREGDIGPVLVTHHETSQPSLGAAIAWVTGLGPSTFERALERARLWSCPPAAGQDTTQIPRRWPYDRH